MSRIRRGVIENSRGVEIAFLVFFLVGDEWLAKSTGMRQLLNT